MNNLPKNLEEVNNYDLSYMNNDWLESMVRDGMRAIIRTNDKLQVREIEVWDYLSKFSPPVDKGFMFCNNEIVSIVGNEMEIGHSGSSMGWTMRELELIAKQGLTMHRSKYVR